MRAIVEGHDLDGLERRRAREGEPVVLADLGGDGRRPQVVIGLALPSARRAGHLTRMLVDEEVAPPVVLDEGKGGSRREEVREARLGHLGSPLGTRIGGDVVRDQEVSLTGLRGPHGGSREPQLELGAGRILGDRSAVPDLTPLERSSHIGVSAGAELAGQDVMDQGACGGRSRDAEQRLGGVIPADHAMGGIGDDHGFRYRVEQAADARAGTDRAPPSSPSHHSCP